MISEILIVLIFLLTFFLIMVRPWRFNETTGALLGALLMLVFLQPHHILEALGFATPFATPQVTTWNVVIILIELMVISTFLDDYGFFEWCAVKAMQMAKGDAWKLFTYTYVVTCLITAFTSNDIAILTLTPIILKFCRRANLNSKPFMYAFFFAANIASMFLLIGNLTNIMIADAFHLGYVDFAAYMFLPTMAALVVNYVIFRYMFRNSITARYQPLEHVNSKDLIKSMPMVAVGLVVLAFVLIGCGFASAIAIPLSAITTIGMIAIYLAERKPMLRTKRISWRVVVFVISLFIVVKGLEVSGVNALAGSAILSIVGQNPIVATFFMSMMSAFLCNVVNNIPMTAMMVPVSLGIAHTQDMALAMAYSLVIGSNLGANITITGALAGILWIECARVEKWTTGITEFIKTGLTVTPLVILASAAVLALEITLF
ncbi:ArsB/NhaD family transporter [Methanocella arvoryzae]|uniref:Transporter (Arsenical pump membrane protein family) n=1 Tax=Methanocella arvoryzae (strain DSM 22066 / NBRC 105507 / MRE50) TaxID=351160 RepID=Q0W0C4_METAR|nr:SLC13 family permease [Methanocella arvoryzae]CAJ38169.1 putative transporter (arsenical pump membrane protein family) [Methanocella arvoryzae MRE50]